MLRMDWAIRHVQKLMPMGGFLVLQCGHTAHNQVSVCSELGGRSRAT